MKCLYLNTGVFKRSTAAYIVIVILLAILKDSNSVRSEHAQISAIRIPGYKYEEVSQPNRIPCDELLDDEGKPFLDCDSPNREPDSVEYNLKIQNKVLVISPEIAEKHRIVLMCNASCPASWRFYPAKV